MDYEEINYRSYSHERELESSAAFPVLMQKTYLWMTMALDSGCWRAPECH